MIIQNLAEEFVKWRDGNCREDGAGRGVWRVSEMPRRTNRATVALRNLSREMLGVLYFAAAASLGFARLS
jgi:hypothetical protein